MEQFTNSSEGGIPPQSISLTRLPIEVRFSIYDELIHTPHTVIITPNGTRRGIFRPLVVVCEQLREEVRKWVKGQPTATIIRSANFGSFDDEVTMFEISWLEHSGYKYDPIHSSITGRYQRCCTPDNPMRYLERLSAWQEAMDFTDVDLEWPY